jgi:hypothetical protein
VGTSIAKRPLQRLSAVAAGIGLDEAEIGPTIASGLQAAIAEPRHPGNKAERAIETPPHDETPPRDFEELLKAAQALEPGQHDDIEAIVRDTAGLAPLRRDAIFRAIKDATKIPLGTLRAQLQQETDTGPDPPSVRDSCHRW